MKLRIMTEPQQGADYATLLAVAQATELGGSDEEGVLHGIGRVGGLTEQGPAVGIQRHGVLVVGLRDPFRVAGHDGGDHVPVLHGHHGSSLTARRSAQTA